MSEVSQEYNKATLGDTELGSVLGTGSGINTGQENVALGTPGNDGVGGIGNTFLTEPLHAEFVKLLEEASFVRQIAKTVTMTQPTLRVPAITSGLEVYYHGEQGQEATETVMSAGDFTLEARKIMAQVIATAELYEDSQQNIEQIITGDFVRAIAQAEEQAFLLGRITPADGATPAKGSLDNGTVAVASDTTNIEALTQFVRKSGLTATDTFQYNHWGIQTGSSASLGSSALSGKAKVATSPLNICDGVVTVALDEGNIVDMQNASFRGGTAYKAIREAIFRLGLLGRDRGQLILILNPVASNQLLQSDELMTLDKYGSNATILTCEVGSLFGVKIIESSFMPSAGISVDDGGLGAVTFGAGGYGVLVHKPSLLLGDLRKVQVENERIIQNDAYRTVISERLAFGVERRNCAVAIGNINPDVTSLSSGSSVFIAGGLAPSLSGDTVISLGSAGVATTTGTANVALDNIDSGEVYSLNVSSIADPTSSIGDITFSLVTSGGIGLSTGDADFSAGDTIALGTASAGGSSNLAITATVDNNLTASDTFTIKVAVFDGSQYSNVHTVLVEI